MNYHQDLLFEKLEIAIYRHDLVKTNKLIHSLGIDYQTQEGRTILQFCLEEAHDSKMFKYLINQYKPNLNLKNALGQTLLFLTLEPKNLSYLIHQKIDIEAKDHKNYTALEYFCFEKNEEKNAFECVELLIQAGANYQNIEVNKEMDPVFKDKLEKLLVKQKIKDKAIEEKNKLNTIIQDKNVQSDKFKIKL